MEQSKVARKMTDNLIDKIGKTLLIGSGAIATCLREHIDNQTPIELLNLTAPKTVTSLYKEYKDAGANIILTNTFGANPLALADSGISASCEEINGSALGLAQTVAANDCLVFASIGPLSLGLRHDDYNPDQLHEIYATQCNALAGADVLALETFTDIREANAAVRAASDTGTPFILQIGNLGSEHDQWDKIEEFIKLAESSQALAIGTNCRHPSEIITVVSYLAGRTSLPITAAPNAGQPTIQRGSITYDFSPAEFLATTNKLISSGASIIGGCCGTTPAHIKAVANLSGSKIQLQTPIQLTPKILQSKQPAKTSKTNVIRELLSQDKCIISVEIRPDRNTSLEAIVDGASIIAKAGATMFDVPDNPGATIGRDASVVASTLQAELNIPCIPHMTVTQSNLLRIHSQLLGSWDLGLQGILAVTGDPPSTGELAHSAKRVADLRSSVELLRLIRKMKDGKTINDQTIAQAPNFCAGASIGTPTKPHLSWLNKKVEAGAEFILSQPIFAMDDFARLQAALNPINVRFLPGVLPLASLKNAEYLASGKIPGINVPESIVKEFAKYTDKKDQKKLGLEMARKLAIEIATTSNSIYLIMPFGKSCYKDTAEIVEAIRNTTKQS